ARQFVPPQASFARRRLVEGQLCPNPLVRGYWFCADRQEQRRFVPAGKAGRHRGTEIGRAVFAQCKASVVFRHATTFRNEGLTKPMRKSQLCWLREVCGVVLFLFATAERGAAIDRHPPSDYRARREAL